MRMRSVSSLLTVKTKRSAKQFARGHRGGIFTASIPAPARTASNDAVDWPARSRTRNRTSRHGRRGPSAGCGPAGWSTFRSVAGRPEDMHVATPDFEGEEHVDPFQGDRAV